MAPLMRRVAVLTLTGLVIYGVAPAVGEVLGAWREVRDLRPWWLALMVLAQVASCWCLWHLQALSIGTRRYRAVALSQLASGALGRVVPGGGATATAAQYGMLTTVDVPRASIATGLAAATVLQVAALCALPALALPAVVLGLSVPSTLVETAALGLTIFGAMLMLGIFLGDHDAALRWCGHTTCKIAHRLPGKARPPRDLPDRLVAHRDELRERLGNNLVRAAAAAIGRWLFDLLTLVAAVIAVGASPPMSLVLLAYVTAQLLAQVPLTPGGIGVVEAGLAATLVVAGVPAADAAVITLAYRLASYWLMLPAGLAAWVVHRRTLVPVV